METGAGRFRTSFFGGFDRRDVVAYLEKIAGERNQYKAEAERLGTELASEREGLAERLEKLQTELDETKAELEETKRRADELHMAAVADAQKAVSELCGEYESIRSDVGVASNRLHTELEHISEGLSRVNESFEQTGARLEELRASVFVGEEG